MAQNNNNDNVIKVSNDTIASGKISIKTSLRELNDADGNSKSLTSTISEIGGLSWRMKVLYDCIDLNMFIFIYCNEGVKDTLWLCKVHFSVCLRQDHPDCTETHSFGPFYAFNTCDWNWYVNTIEFDDDEPLEIELDIKISLVEKNFPPLDTTLAIKIDENRTETFFINKELLATFSTYFRNLFFGDWSDNKKAQNYFEIVETEDFDVKAFSYMIYSAMTMGPMVHESNFLQDGNYYDLSIKILKLAIKYGMPFLVDYCEKYLMHLIHCDNMPLIELAEQYSLNNLKEHCLNELTVEELMDNFSKIADFYSRISKNTQERLQAILSGKKEEMRKSLRAIDNAIKLKQPVAEQFKKMKKYILGEK